MDNDKLRIYICSHNDFKPYVKNDSGCFKIAYAKKQFSTFDNIDTVVCNVDGPLDDKFYSEIYAMRYIVDHEELPEYVGICHYRRYWDCFDDVKQLTDKLEKSDIIIPKLYYFNTNAKIQYAVCHNVEDLDIIENIIKEKYPEYVEGYRRFTESNMFIRFNMYIMKREDFIDCVNFVWNVLQDYIGVVGTDIKKRIDDNKNKYIKKYPPNNTAEYQYRIGGYLGERLTNIFIFANLGARFKAISEQKVDTVEEKYGKKF